MDDRRKTVAGFAHLFSFPFWLYVNLDSALKTGLSVFPKRIGLRFYPPFRSAPANFSGMPGISGTAIPFDDRVRPEQPLVVIQMAVAPLLSAEGGPGTISHWGPNWNNPPRLFPMDSLRIDVVGTTAREIGLDAIVRRLLERLRVKTCQWWIMRAGASHLGYERNNFPINKHGGSLALSANAEEHVRIPFGFESAINDHLWTTCVEEAVRGVETSVAELSLLDAFYFVAAEDTRNAIMHGCWALEQAVETEFTRLWRAQGRRKKLRGHDLTGLDATTHLSRDADRYFHRSFSREFPCGFRALRKMWRVRNDIAHGRWGQDTIGTATAVSNEDLEIMTRSARVALRWLRSL